MATWLLQENEMTQNHDVFPVRYVSQCLTYGQGWSFTTRTPSQKSFSQDFPKKQLITNSNHQAKTISQNIHPSISQKKNISCPEMSPRSFTETDFHPPKSSHIFPSFAVIQLQAFPKPSRLDVPCWAGDLRFFAILWVKIKAERSAMWHRIAILKEN